MHRFFRRFTRPIAMLLLAVMVLMPVADAFSCALESETDHAVEFAVDGDQAPHDRDDSGEEGREQAPHGVCVHNHCHHTTADMPPQVAVGAFYAKAGNLYPVNDASHLANLSDRLMRPPRI